jgi:hypothetical protein
VCQLSLSRLSCAVAASRSVKAPCSKGSRRRTVSCWEHEQAAAGATQACEQHAVGAAQAEEEGGELLGVKPVEVARLNPAGAPIFSLAVDGAAPDPSAALPDARQQARRPSRPSPKACRAATGGLRPVRAPSE